MLASRTPYSYRHHLILSLPANVRDAKRISQLKLPYWGFVTHTDYKCYQYTRSKNAQIPITYGYTQQACYTPWAIRVANFPCCSFEDALSAPRRFGTESVRDGAQRLYVYRKGLSRRCGRQNVPSRRRNSSSLLTIAETNEPQAGHPV
mgnify:CR=1 FL=1